MANAPNELLTLEQIGEPLDKVGFTLEKLIHKGVAKTLEELIHMGVAKQYVSENGSIVFLVPFSMGGLIKEQIQCYVFPEGDKSLFIPTGFGGYKAFLSNCTYLFVPKGTSPTTGSCGFNVYLRECKLRFVKTSDGYDGIRPNYDGLFYPSGESY
jgi:hypothetical protein